MPGPREHRTDADRRRAAFLEARGLVTVSHFQCAEEGRPSVGASCAFPPLLGLPLITAACWEPCGHQS